MTRARAPLVLCVALAGCIQGSTWIEPPPPEPPQPPMPKPFASQPAQATPALAPTAYTGLFRAPSVSENLYYYEPDELWYRRWKGRWYQAFAWDGHWFPPRQVPQALKDLAAAQRAATPEPQTEEPTPP